MRQVMLYCCPVGNKPEIFLTRALSGVLFVSGGVRQQIISVKGN